MTYAETKEKLHFLVEKADEKKVMAIYTLLAEDEENILKEGETEYTYDDKTIAMLEQRAEDVFSGKVKAYTMEESIERLKQLRAQRGL